MAATPTQPPNHEDSAVEVFLTADIKRPDKVNFPAQYLFITSPKKRKIVRAGRRGGKTTGAAILAVLYFMQGKRVLYAAPTIEQVNAFWTEVVRSLANAIDQFTEKTAAHHGFSVRKLESDKTIEIIDSRGVSLHQQIRAKTAWNADTLRGGKADLLILDEWQMMDELAWAEAGAPILMDTDGDCVFIYTPPSARTKSITKARDPRHASKMFKDHENDPRWLCLHFRSMDNPHISKSGIAEMSHDMSKLAYRQEILAEDEDIVPGALWTRQMIEDSRVKKENLPTLIRIVVGVDPPGSKTNECGICAVGEGQDGHLYILDDKSLLASPKNWATTTVELYHSLNADRVVGEANYGGTMVRATIEEIDDKVSYKDVFATRGKIARAEPICALFETTDGLDNDGKPVPAPRCHIVGEEMAKLEDEMCSYVKGETKSPNRLDAMVWAATEILGGGNFGLIDALKTGILNRFNQETPVTIEKVAVPRSLAAVKTNDRTVSCESCGCKVLQVVGGGGLRCSQCGTQKNPAAMKKATPGRRSIYL